MKLPEGNDIGKAINEGMVAIEADNSEVNHILPKNYNQFDNRIPVSLLKIFKKPYMINPQQTLSSMVKN